MKKYVALALFLIGTAVAAESTKVGTVFPEQVFKESKYAQLASKKLNDEFSQRRIAIESQIATIKQKASSLERDGSTLSEQQMLGRQAEISDLDRSIQKSQREFQADLESRRRTEIQGVLDRIDKIVKRIAEEEHYDFILQNAVYATQAIDLTKQVIVEIDKENPQ